MTDLGSIVYTANETAKLALADIEAFRAKPDEGMRFGLSCVDKMMHPIRPGSLVVVLGRPSNYKSGLMEWLARQEAQKILDSGVENEVVIYVTWEMPIEDFGVYDLASIAEISTDAIQRGNLSDEQMQKVRLAAVKRGTVPLWLVGHSIARRKRRPRLSMSNVAQALMWVDNEMKFRPRAVFLDYLQQMNSDIEGDRRMQVFENVCRCKDMALALACPVILGVQARREVDQREWKLPLLGDGQETSNIEQTADVALAVWMPKTTEQIGSRLRNTELIVTPNLLLLGMVKQRKGPAGMWWPLYAEPTRNFIGEMTKETLP